MPEYRARLLKTIPSSRLSLLKLVADEAVLRALPLYLVGGFVRDLLLGRQAQLVFPPHGTGRSYWLFGLAFVKQRW